MRLSSVARRASRKAITSRVRPEPSRLTIVTWPPIGTPEKSMIDVIAFGRGDRQGLVGDRRREQALVGADLDEIEPAPVVGDRFELVVPGVGGVQDAQPVSGRVDLVHGPRCAVDQDHVAQDAREVRLVDARPLPQGGVERRDRRGCHRRRTHGP